MDWPAFAGVMWLALGFGMLSERWQAPGLAFARWADRRYLGPQRLMDGLCLPVAMQPASHSLTRTYSRPPGLAFRYQVTDRCWHCDAARPHPATGWRVRFPLPPPRPGYDYHLALLGKHPPPWPPGWLCPACRHGNHGCAPGLCRAPVQCRVRW